MIMIRNYAAGRALERSIWRHLGRESVTGLFIGALRRCSASAQPSGTATLPSG